MTCSFLLLDFELDGNAHENAVQLTRAASRKNARLGIAAHSLKDMFYLIQARLKLQNQLDLELSEPIPAAANHAVAWAVIDHILERAEVVGSDYTDAYLATKHRPVHDDFEDNLVLAAARRMDADMMVTSDRALLAHSPISAMTPEDAVKWLETI